MEKVSLDFKHKNPSMNSDSLVLIYLYKIIDMYGTKYPSTVVSLVKKTL